MNETGPSLSEISFHPESTKKVESRDEFNFDDLVFLEEQGVGLRHLSTRNKAEENMINGFVGDALALSSIGISFLKNADFLFKDNQEAQSRLKIFKIMSSHPNLEFMKEFFNDEQKGMIVDLLHKNVTTFIQKYSLDMDLEVYRGETTEGDVLSHLDNGTSFLLVQCPNITSSDEDGYEGLGKFGKRHFDKTDVLDSVFGKEASDTIRNRNDFNPNNVADDSFFDKVAESYYELIVRKVKERRTVGK